MSANLVPPITTVAQAVRSTAGNFLAAVPAGRMNFHAADDLLSD